MLARAAFAVDVLEGNLIRARTVHPHLAEVLRSVMVGANELPTCELDAVRLMY
jgi:hypothetical protein